MDLKQLQYFMACARCKSMSRAAEQLYTSQPHVSSVIKSLERELSVELFLRLPGGIALTREGEQVYEYAQNIQRNVTQMRLSCQRSCGKRLALMSNSSKRMGAFFARFYQDHCDPDASFTYLEGGLEDILESLVSQKVELGFSFLAENRASALQSYCRRHLLTAETLSCSDMVLYVGKHSPHYDRQSISVAELKHLRYVQMEEDYFGLDDLLFKLLPPGEHASRIVTTNSNNGIIQLLLNTELANLGSYWKKDFYLDRDIRLIPIEEYKKKIYFTAIYQQLSPLAAEYLSDVKKALLEEADPAGTA